MAHIHSVYDTDNHFKVDAITRKITDVSNSKTSLVQGDHNSERFTFEIPRYIEGHDMLTCNEVQVHYLNIEKAKKYQKAGIYVVEDLQESPESEDVVICSWLISGNATKYVGSLNFLLRFVCRTDEDIDYAWNTAIHPNIAVAEGIYNGDEIIAEYPDILEQWRKELMNSGIGGVSIPNGAKVGQIIQVAKVDENGQPTEWVAMDWEIDQFSNSYDDLYFKPSINGVTLSGNKTSADLGIGDPTDEQVATAVETWLDAHPEATTTVADGSITPEKTSWMRPIYNNEYNTADPDAQDGYFFYSGSSAGTSGGGSAAYSVSGFIPVVAGRQYCFNKIRSIRWLDSAKAFVAAENANNAVNSIKTAPENAAYVRFDVTTANKEAAYMYEYVGVSFDFAAYHSSHILVSNEDAYDDFLALTVGKKVSEGALDLGAVIPDENLHLRQLSGMTEWHWNIVDPDEVKVGSIYARTTATPGQDYNLTDGTTFPRRTGYIPVTPGEELRWIGYNLYCYDSDKNYVQILSPTSGKGTIPDGVAYIRATATGSGVVPVFNILRNKYGTAYTYLDTVDYNDVIPQLKNPERLENYKVYLGLYKWGGKSFCFIGDSFSAPGTWQNEMCDRLMAVYTANPSVSGGRWSDTADPACAYEQAQSLVSGGYVPDVIFCMLGANDGGNAVTLGNIVESTDIADFDLTTYTGGMQACINYLQNNFPDAVIYVGWTPAGANCNFVSASAAEPYIERMKEVCLMYGVEYLEVRTCGITKYSAAYADCFESGTGGGHPTNAGHLKIGEYMARLVR